MTKTRLHVTQIWIALFLLMVPQAQAVDLAATPDNYYGSINSVESLRDRLHTVLNDFHVSQGNRPDLISEDCGSNSCYRHNPLNYREAREMLFGQIHLKSQNNQYFVKTSYCQKIITDREADIGPLKIPSHQQLNTEHAWPQSHFTSYFPKGVQKTDLHALFPVESDVNSIRGNRPFGNVKNPNDRVCDLAKMGDSDQNPEKVFEPANAVKGDVARALFYFATRYNTDLDDYQEAVLRDWHNQDPVDFEELQRNDEIFSIQHTRNPFIDHPEWVDQIDDF